MMGTKLGTDRVIFWVVVGDVGGLSAWLFYDLLRVSLYPPMINPRYPFLHEVIFPLVTSVLS